MSHDVEQRLRAALAARADQVTAESVGPQRPVEARVTALPRRRFGRAAALLAAAASVAVVIGAGAVVRNVAERPVPDHSGSAASSAVSPSGSPPVSFEGTSFTVPDGWVYRVVAEGTACVQPAGSPRPDGECTPHGVEVRVGGGNQWPKDAIDRDSGWHNGSAECKGVAHPDERFSEVTSNRLTVREDRPVGERVAAYREWKVRCDSDIAFVVRLWWQPDIPLVVVTRALAPKYDVTVDRFVATIRV